MREIVKDDHVFAKRKIWNQCSRNETFFKGFCTIGFESVIVVIRIRYYIPTGQSAMQNVTGLDVSL